MCRGCRGCRGHRGRRSRRGHRGHGSQKCRVGVDILSVDFAQPKFVLSFFSPLSIPFLCSLGFPLYPSSLPLFFLPPFSSSFSCFSFSFFSSPSTLPLPLSFSFTSSFSSSSPLPPLPTPYFTVTLYRNEPLQMMMKKWGKLDKVHASTCMCISILSLVLFPNPRYKYTRGSC